jgi:hypothetical protein
MYKVAVIGTNQLPIAYIVFTGIVDDKQRNVPELPIPFTEEERTYITGNNIPIIRSALQLHPDEPIRDIKRKLITIITGNDLSDQDDWEDIQAQLNTDGPRAMYMFGLSDTPFSPLDTYRKITEQENRPLTKPMLDQWVNNYSPVLFGSTDETETQPTRLVLDKALIDSVKSVTSNPVYASRTEYTYEDLMDMDWFVDLSSASTNRKQQVTRPRWIPLGQKFPTIVTASTQTKDDSDLFSANPFLIARNHVPVPVHSKLHSREYDFLFSYRLSETQSTLYLSTSDVATAIWEDQQKTDLPRLIQLYFPEMIGAGANLATTNVTDKLSSTEIKTQMLVDYISTLANHPDHRKLVAVPASGIKHFYVTIHPRQSRLSFPLETIFKQVHATRRIPLIQYNPGMRREKLHRVYYETTAQNGNQIPFIREQVILDMKRRTGKLLNLSFFVWLKSDDELSQQSINDFVQIILFPDGTIDLVSGTMNVLIPELEFDTWLPSTILPVFQQMNQFLGSSGFAIRETFSLLDDHVETVELDYSATMVPNIQVNLQPVMPLMNSFLYTEPHDIPIQLSDQLRKQQAQKGEMAILQQQDYFRRYLRVESFERTDPQIEYLTRLSSIESDKKVIKEKLMDQFKLSSAQAQNVLATFQAEYRTSTSGKTVTRRLRRNHNGFKVHLFKQKFDNVWTIDISGIYSIHYVPLLRNYMTALFIASLHTPTNHIISPEFVPMLTTAEINASEVATNNARGQLQLQQQQQQQLQQQPPQQQQRMMGDESESDDEESPNAVSSQIEAEERAGEDEAINTEFAFFEEEDGDDSSNNSSSPDATGSMSDLSQGGEKGSTAPQHAGASGKQAVGDYFWTRIYQKDPSFKGIAYSRICQSSVRRQPAVMTKTELDQVNERYKNKAKPYAGEPIKYRQTPSGEDLYYICPKFWCMKSDMVGPISEADVNAGKCGNIIKDTKDIKPGEFVYPANPDFTHPGFVNQSDSTTAKLEQATGKKGAKISDEQKGLCFPCCFKTHGEALQQQINKCTKGVDNNKRRPDEKREREIDANSGQMQPLMNTTPLPLGRIGFMPVAIRRMLNITNSCVNRQNYPEPGCPLLVRYGVLQTDFPEQSFLASMADVYAYQRGEASPPHLSEFRRIIARAIDIDRFIKLHNASLVAIFRMQSQGGNQNPVSSGDNIRPYMASELYRRLNHSDPAHVRFFASTVQSYENFVYYLLNTSSPIDHTYLWEAMCQPNPLLMRVGLNLAIMHVTNADITDNVDLLCPPNQFGVLRFNPALGTLFLVKQGAIYEPIYLYTINPDRNILIRKTFLPIPEVVRDAGDIPVILRLLERLADQRCAPDSSRSTVFSTNVLAPKILSALQEHPNEFKVTAQVSNFQNKCIALVVQCTISDNQSMYFNKRFSVYLPTFPSALFPETQLPVVMMDAPNLWKKYSTTVDLLTYIKQKCVKSIMLPCAPAMNVVDENDMIVGILTESNQFVRIVPVQPVNYETTKKLPVLHNSDFILADKAIQTTDANVHANAEDNEHAMFVRNMRLQSQFYVAFRNTVRHVINLYANRRIRQQLRDIGLNRQLTYREKRKAIVAELKTIVSPYVMFREYDPAVIASMGDVHACTATATNQPFCSAPTVITKTTNKSIQKLIIPRTNLAGTVLSPGKENEQTFFHKVADEFVRYRAIQAYMMQPNAIYLEGSIDYQVQANEVILPGSVFDDSYFNNLVPFPPNVKLTTYETAPTQKQLANQAVMWADQMNQIRATNQSVPKNVVPQNAVPKNAVSQNAVPQKQNNTLPEPTPATPSSTSSSLSSPPVAKAKKTRRKITISPQSPTNKRTSRRVKK